MTWVRACLSLLGALNGKSILQRLKINFVTIRSSLVTSSSLYFITCCVKRWSCMSFLWLLHGKYNIVASKELSYGGTDKVVILFWGFFFFFLLLLSFRKCTLMFSHKICWSAFLYLVDGLHVSVTFFFFYVLYTCYISLCICIIRLYRGIFRPFIGRILIIMSYNYRSLP